jgi:hypothetical protein
MVSLPTLRDEKSKCYIEVAGLAGSLIISYTLGILLFSKFLGFTGAGLIITGTLILLTIVIGLMAVLRLLKYRKYEERERLMDY